MTLASKFTMLRIVFSPLIVAIAAIGFANWNIYAAVVFIIASITDTVDGQIARKYNQISDFGKLIDPIADKLLTSASMIVLISWHKMLPIIGIVLVARDIMVSAMRVLAADHKLVVAARNSGKIKTVLQLLAYGAYFLNLDLLGHILLAGGVLTTMWSLFDYLYANRHVITGKLFVPFVLSFADKLFTGCMLFVLLYMNRLPGLIAMLIMGKDNVISGFKAMSSTSGNSIPNRASELLCFVLTSALLVSLLFGCVWYSGIGFVLFILSCAAVLWSLVDVGLQSNKKASRVK